MADQDVTVEVRQVQCQRTRRYIAASPSGPTVVCPWCDEQETYRRLGPDDEAWHHVQQAIEMCRAEFKVPDDGRVAAIWLGSRPETVFERHLDRHNIYLGRNSDRWQLMYSGSHEAFHRVCGEQKNALHWADEMLAVLFSLLYLERIGEIEHAHRNRAGLVEETHHVSRQEMLDTTHGPLSNGFYGQAYLLGEELRQIVGWEEMKGLSILRTAEGFPDIEAWVASLTTEVREDATRLVLGSAEL